jgi:hypothetical protein
MAFVQPTLNITAQWLVRPIDRQLLA